jgi:subtilisin family serine protease
MLKLLIVPIKGYSYLETLKLAEEYSFSYGASYCKVYKNLLYFSISFNNIEYNDLNKLKQELSSDNRVNSYNLENNFTLQKSFNFPPLPPNCPYSLLCETYEEDPIHPPAPENTNNICTTDNVLKIKKYTDNRLLFLNPTKNNKDSSFDCRTEGEPHPLAFGPEWPRIPDPNSLPQTLSYFDTTAWHLDRISKRNLPLDRKYPCKTPAYQVNNPSDVPIEVVVFVIDISTPLSFVSISEFFHDGIQRTFSTRKISLGQSDKDHAVSVASLINGENYGVSRRTKVNILGCDESFYGTIPESEILECLDLILENRINNPQSRYIINLSLGIDIPAVTILQSGGSSYQDVDKVPLNAVEQALLKCIENNIHVVVAAGNGSKAPKYLEEISSHRPVPLRPVDANGCFEARLGGNAPRNSSFNLPDDTGIITVGSTSLVTQGKGMACYHPKVFFNFSDRFKHPIPAYSFIRNDPRFDTADPTRLNYIYQEFRANNYCNYIKGAFSDTITPKNLPFPPTGLIAQNKIYYCPEINPGFFADIIAEFSNFGVRVDIYAPGESIIASTGDGGSRVIKGTSFSAPLVVGVLAEILFHHDTDLDQPLTPKQVKDILLEYSTSSPQGLWNYNQQCEGIMGLYPDKGDNNRLLYNPFNFDSSDDVSGQEEDEDEEDAQDELKIVIQPELVFES